MIVGILRHGIDMEINRSYVDSHGQTEVAFAFTHMLRFDLAPRIKRITRVKLYIPDNSMKSRLRNLTPVLTRAIDWKLIEEQFDEIYIGIVLQILSILVEQGRSVLIFVKTKK